jgi:carbonic anhydrase/acetyltransferase-like protein (isoleucine patch superfamily)
MTPGSPGLRPRVTPSPTRTTPDATVTGKVQPQPPALIALTTVGRADPQTRVICARLNAYQGCVCITPLRI